MAAVEQNFNPSLTDIQRRTAMGKTVSLAHLIFAAALLIFCVCVCAGYPRLLSGDMKNISKVAENHQTSLFPEPVTENVWSKDGYVKRYYLSFPFYPFRTLCPRYLNMLATMGGGGSGGSKMNNLDFDPTSPMLPANTQMNIVFHKRNITNFLPYMLPYNLDSNLGTNYDELTLAQKQAATKFQLVEVGQNQQATTRNYLISKVEISIKNIYLQVTLSAIVFLLSSLFIIVFILDLPHQIQGCLTGEAVGQCFQQLQDRVYTDAESEPPPLRSVVGVNCPTVSCHHWICKVRVSPP